MRVTGGVLRGRQVSVPPGEIRPAMDRMRESIFAILGDLSEISFLDLFSGSGIIALEAASRGAAYLEAVEKDPAKRVALLKNIALSPTRIQCRFQPVELYVRRAKRAFDIIFCDPPFSYRWKAALVADIAASPLMREGSRLLLHRPRGDEVENAVAALGTGGLILLERREYGRSIVDCFIKKRVE
jgi:16S rRNA (guanine(966)-N(2))-methyltransferase RsmD